LEKSSTWNETSQQFMYPQTPSRLQLSIWPAGLPTNAPGTIAWAGGEIDWDSPDIQQYGYDYATFGEITVQCYSPPTGANIQGDVSYIYTSAEATNNTVEITNDPTVLSSFEGTGTNMTAGAVTASGTRTSTASSTASDSVPSESNGGSGSEASGHPTTVSGSSSSTNTGFNQGGTPTTNPSIATTERVAKGSFFAVLIAVVVLVTM
jgi:beta-glucanase (GH16 family)